MKEFILKHVGRKYSSLGCSFQKKTKTISKRFYWRRKTRVGHAVRNGSDLYSSVRRISDRYRVISFISANI